MDVIKKNWKLINLVLYIVCAVCWIFPMYSLGVFGVGVSISAFTMLFEISILGIILFICPILGLVFLLAPSKNSPSTIYVLELIVAVVGIILIFVTKGLAGGSYSSLLSLGFGGILSVLCYVAIAVVNGIMMANKEA